jgi:hypothetical protein
MSDADPQRDPHGEVETALLDVELFVKYKAPERAIGRLCEALVKSPRSVRLRECLREIAAQSKLPEEAARQCLALASLYIERQDLDTAHDRLLEAKHLDARISIASGLEAIRRARRPESQKLATQADQRAPHTFTGDLSAVGFFDVVQALENARLTGALSIDTGLASTARILFNEGRIVGAEMSEATGEEAFRKVIEVTHGTFDFQRSKEEFPITIYAASNTNLLLDSLHQLDEHKNNS